MIGFLVRSLKKIRRQYLPNTFIGLSFLRIVYRAIARCMTFLPIRGVPVQIGGCGYFRIEPELVFGHYDYALWGRAHNSGFRQWVGACSRQRVVFDIGAHIGLYTLPASRVIDPSGRLYAFEPGERNSLALQHHLLYNKIRNVEVLPYCIGAHDDAAVPFFERGDSVEGKNSILKRSGPSMYRETLKQQVSLDSFCFSRNIIPTVMKIDVEGGELRVLNGGKKFLKQYHPVIFLSIHPRHLSLLGESVEELRCCIEELGYRIYDTQGYEVRSLLFDEYVLKSPVI